MMSLEPAPAANGTTMRTDLLGYACAIAVDVSSKKSSATKLRETVVIGHLA